MKDRIAIKEMLAVWMSAGRPWHDKSSFVEPPLTRHMSAPIRLPDVAASAAQVTVRIHRMSDILITEIIVSSTSNFGTARIASDLQKCDCVADVVAHPSGKRRTRLAAILSGLQSWILKLNQRRIIAELELMDDRLLADIGLSRSDISNALQPSSFSSQKVCAWKLSLPQD